jgi:hypothetical protein
MADTYGVQIDRTGGSMLKKALTIYVGIGAMVAMLIASL